MATYGVLSGEFRREFRLSVPAPVQPLSEVRAEVDKLAEEMAERTSKATKLDEVKSSKVWSAIAEVRAEVHKLEERVAALATLVDDGTTIEEKEFTALVELLMRQVLKLDGIEADGLDKVQRKIEVRRVQKLVDTVDSLRGRNSNSIRNSIKTSSSVVAPEFESGVWLSRVDLDDGLNPSSGIVISAAADKGKESEGEFASSDREVRDGLTIIRADGLVRVVDPSGNETVLNPKQILGLVGVDVQERLLPIFQRRPETFLRVPELSTCFAFYFLSGLDRILNFLEDRTVGGVTNDGVSEIRRMVNDCKMGLRIDWIEGPLLEILNFRNTRANLAQVESRIHELRDTLSRLEKEKSSLTARLLHGPLVDPSTGEIDLEMTLAEAVQRIEH
ncbi:hypothetical protein U1Q18_013619 [Sarracenia purpurea var. burkii]